MPRLVHICLLDLEKDKMAVIQHKSVEARFEDRRQALQGYGRRMGVDDMG